MSSGAAGIYAASVTLTEVMHLSYIMEEMGSEMNQPFTIHIDNTTAIAFLEGNGRRPKLKHIDMRQQWAEWLRNKGLISLAHVGTKVNIADFFTKILHQGTFCRLRSMAVLDRPIDGTLRARP